jgi:hypothetical protein
MAVSFENILLYGGAGAALGTVVYLYQNGYLLDILGDTPIPDDSDETPPTGPAPTTPAPNTGQYVYYAKRKLQCRDAHLTFPYLVSQKVRVVNYKIHNDGLIYNQVCGTPGPLYILVAIAAGDAQSGSILSSLGFVQYQAPQQQPNPSVPIPNPPAPLPSSNYAMAYVGKRGNHRAYKSFR